MEGRRTDALVAAARRVGVGDDRVLAALAAVPRDRFVPRSLRSQVGDDRPLRTAAGQTTSQPSLIASMLAALRLSGDERVLEVGTGTGYEAALLAHLAGEVFTIERVPELAGQARRNLARCGLRGVEVVVGDGTRGLPEHAPYDAIVVAAAADRLPAALGEQLREGGRLIAPLGPPDRQTVVLHERRDGRLDVVQRLTPVRFVPLVPDPPGTAE
jgi:protein-L-isoaspartate(D-aspartate) O-methyltransferase